MLYDPYAIIEFIAFWFVDLWWLWSFVILFFLSRALWLSYIQERFKKTAINPILLELRMPREVKKNPRAMEQVLLAIHAVRNAPSNIEDKWWGGEVTLWFSLEVVSFGGEVHFFIRLPERHRNMVEAAFYAHYADIELIEMEEDYTLRFPSTMQELWRAGYQIFGNELILAKPDAFPIKTYNDFESSNEDWQLDPISSLLEIFVKVKPQEQVWLQILIRPADDTWKKEGERVMRELKEKSGRRQVQTPLGEFVMIDRSPGEIEVMKAVDKNLEKPGFETLIRYLYIAPQEIYSSNFGQRAVISGLNQYASETLNKFRHNVDAWTRASFWFWPHFFPKRRADARRERMYKNYLIRKMHDETFASAILGMKLFDWGIKGQRKGKYVLNTEEIATIFHPPTINVQTGPLIKRVEARKVGPPAGLPIYGDDEEKIPGMQ